MRQNRIRGEWAGSSHLKERYNELKKAHEEFQRLLDSGYEITAVKKSRRPRIQKAKTPKKVVISVLGNKTTVTYQEYLNRCQGFKIVMEIF